jgi:hypothetical protein
LLELSREVVHCRSVLLLLPLLELSREGVHGGSVLLLLPLLELSHEGVYGRSILLLLPSLELSCEGVHCRSMSVYVKRVALVRVLVAFGRLVALQLLEVGSSTSAAALLVVRWTFLPEDMTFASIAFLNGHPTE